MNEDRIAKPTGKSESVWGGGREKIGELMTWRIDEILEREEVRSLKGKKATEEPVNRGSQLRNVGRDIMKGRRCCTHISFSFLLSQL